MPHSASAIESYAAIRAGEFEKALGICRGAIELDPNDFWSHFLAAIASGYLKQSRDFLYYIGLSEQLSEDSPYLIYLHAYAVLWEGDIEKALWYWSQLIPLKEGWLAKELLEKARKGKPLVEMAKEEKIADFIILPDFLGEIKPRESSDEIENNEISNPKVPQKETFFTVFRKRIPLLFPYRYLLIGAISFLSVSFLTYFLWDAWPIEKPTRENKVPDMHIRDWANLVPPQNKHKGILFHYENRNSLIDDFNTAKKKLQNNKVNQSLYLWRRIVYSNADFKTKEKSKIYLNFIPFIGHTDFNDPVLAVELIKEPNFYIGAIVLWQGKILKTKKVNEGTEFRFLVTEKEVDYIIEGFLKSNVSDQAIQDIKDFTHEKNLNDRKDKKALFYGKYKGLLGRQKSIYIELQKVWL